MTQKNVQFSPNGSTMAKIQDNLRKRSSEALELARKRILEIEVETSQGQQAIKLYAKNWDDITHPGMLALACEAVGGRPEKSVPLQVATLLLTAAMDLHDDVIDKSEVKNGKMTVYGKYGSEIAILIGDAFLLEGYLLLEKHMETTTETTVTKILDTIEKAFVRIGNAHLLEVKLREKKAVSPQEYLRIVEKKASTIEVHFRIGAVLGNGTEDQIEALGEYGRILGMLIMLREDYIDLFETKELANRMKNELPPFQILCAFQDSDLKKKVLGILHKTEISKKEVNSVLRALRNAEVINDFRRQMQEMAKKASEAIEFVKEEVKLTLNLLIQATLEDI